MLASVACFDVWTRAVGVCIKRRMPVRRMRVCRGSVLVLRMGVICSGVDVLGQHLTPRAAEHRHHKTRHQPTHGRSV